MSISRGLVSSVDRASDFRKRNLTYPMSLPVSQGVFMPSFVSIGPKLWALEGYIHTDRQTVLLLLYRFDTKKLGKF